MQNIFIKLKIKINYRIFRRGKKKKLKTTILGAGSNTYLEIMALKELL